MTRRLSTILLTLVLLTPAFASPDDASKFANNLGNKALAVLKDETLDPLQKEAHLVDIFSNTVDVKWIGKFVLGKYWNRISDEEKTQYMEYYSPFLIRSYTSRFTEYSDESFEIVGARETGDEEYLVETKILRTNGQQPVLANYRVRKTENSTYKVFDIIVEGVSLIATQRSEFGAIMNRKGIDYLIGKLEQRVNKLTALPKLKQEIAKAE